MRDIRFPFALLVAFLALVASPPLAHARWTHDPTTGVPVMNPLPTWYLNLTAGGEQAVSDGFGGAFVVWTDQRQGIGNSDVYVQRVDADGNLLWAGPGVPVATLGSNSTNPIIASDKAGGVVVVWTDDRNGNLDIFAQRYNAGGTALWTADGLAVCVAAGDQTEPQFCSDHIGGGYVVWTDARGGAATDIYVQRLAGAGGIFYGASGLAVCTAAGIQNGPQIVENGSQGAIMCWRDQRTDTGDIYAQNLTLAGSLFWAANGVPVCTAFNTQADITLMNDGGTGAVAAWSDFRSGTNYDTYAQRINTFGSVLWTSNGVAVCTAAGDQTHARICPDVFGAAVIAWTDARNPGYDVYAQRTSLANGASLWTADGVSVCSEQGDQVDPVVVADSTGGTYVVWRDERRTTTQGEFYAQHLAEAGYRQWTTTGVPVATGDASSIYFSVASSGPDGIILLGVHSVPGFIAVSPFVHKVDRWGYQGGEPFVTGVRDVANDQGGRVKVSWDASPLDTDPRYFVVTAYDVYRSAPTALVQGALASGRVTDSAAHVTTARDDARPLLRTVSRDGVLAYWELIGTQPAAHLPNYSLVSPTTGDSVAASNPRTSFLVQARNNANYWTSNADSGYSVDNRAPLAPAPFTGVYAGGITLMQWNRNTESDLAGYRLYRGTNVGFVPSLANRVAVIGDNVYSDPASLPYVYKLTAVDVHGNESLASTLIPSGALAVGADEPAFFLAPASPNPVRAATGIAIRFGLARAGRASLVVHDTQGRRVRVLAAGDLAAGAHTVRFEGRGERGERLAPGLYLVRLEAGGLVANQRLVVIE